MKISSFVILFSLFFTRATAQTPQVPAGNPGKPQLPTPKIQPLQPADLIVSGITLVSAVLNPDTKMYVVKVIVTTKNIGLQQAVKTQLSGFIQKPSVGSWKLMSDPGNVKYIDPGKTYSAVYSFSKSSLEMGVGPFEFRAKTDSGNFVTEADEENNFSETISINPRRS